MRARLMEANPLAEEIRNQIAIKRGPIVYCLESQDLPSGVKIDDVLIPSDIKLTPKKVKIDGSDITALEGEVSVSDEADWKGTLYREVGTSKRTVKVSFIPYYAWGNRGKGEMTVWMPLARK